jgi:predicted dehydrogenase
MSAVEQLRVGMIGCGLIGNSHAAALADVAQARLVAVHDVDGQRSNALAAKHCVDGTAAVRADVDQVLEAVDAVYICTWTSEHPALVSAAVDAGLAVFCEKPLAVDLATATAMTEEVQQRSVVNQVGLVLRHSPAFRVLQHLINTPEAGPIMNVVFRDDQYLPTQGMYGSTWRGDVARAGAGTLLEHSIHDLDLIEWLIGPVADISARTGNHHGLAGIEDHASVRLVSGSGAFADLISVWHDVLTRPSQRRVEVFTGNGYFCLEGDWNGPVSWEVMSPGGGDATGSLSGAALEAEAARLDGRGARPDADFVAAVLADRPASPDFALALEAHRLADAAYRSAAAGGETLPTPPLR